MEPRDLDLTKFVLRLQCVNAGGAAVRAMWGAKTLGISGTVKGTVNISIWHFIATELLTAWNRCKQ